MADGDRRQPPTLHEEGVLSPSLRSTKPDPAVPKTSNLRSIFPNSRPNNPTTSVAHSFSFGQVSAATIHQLDAGTTSVSYLEAAKNSIDRSEPFEAGELSTSATVVNGQQEPPSGTTATLRLPRSASANPLFVTEFTSKQLSSYQGKPAVTFYNTDIEQALAEMKFVLVGKFTHGRPNMLSIKEFFGKINLRSSINISQYDKKHILIECSCKSDFIRLWMKLIWSIKGFSMRVFKWDSQFAPSKESSIAPVWIRIEGLPLFLFGGNSLCAIANAIGNPLCIDPSNINRTNLGTARICVELDASKPCIDSIRICIVDKKTEEISDGFWVKILYDFMPLYCTVCSHIGHDQRDCKRSEAGQVFDTIPQPSSNTVQKDFTSAMLPLDVPERAAPDSEALADEIQTTNGDVLDPFQVTKTEAVKQQNGVSDAHPVAEQNRQPAESTVAQTNTVRTGAAVSEPVADPGSTKAVGKSQVWMEVKRTNPVIKHNDTSSIKQNQITTKNSFIALATETEMEVTSVSKHGLQGKSPLACISPTARNFAVENADRHTHIHEEGHDQSNAIEFPEEDTSPAVKHSKTTSEVVKFSPLKQKLDTPDRRAEIPTVQQVECTPVNQVAATTNNSSVAKGAVQELTVTIPVNINSTTKENIVTSTATSTTTGGVTTRAAAKKLTLKPTTTKENSTKDWVASTFKTMDKIRNDSDRVKEEVMQRAIAAALAKDVTDEDLQKPFIPPKPTTKDGCPAVTFKTADLRRWIAKERTRTNKETEQMCANGFPFDDKG